MTGQWVSFHTHTSFSVLDGASRIPDLVSRAKELGMPALGVSDHGSLSGAYQLWRAATETGIKPVIGIEIYVAPGSRLEKRPVYWGAPEQKKEDVSLGAYTHMLLVAKSATGLRNLYKLHQLSYTEGYYYKPRVDLDVLAVYADGLAGTTGCAGGAIPTLLKLDKWAEAKAYGERLKKIFGDNLYLEMMHHGTDFDEDLNNRLLVLNSQLGLPLLATNDSHYTHPEDAVAHQALLCVQTKSTLADPKFVFSGSGYYLKSYEEMVSLPLPLEALENTLRLAESVESYDDVFQKRDLMPKVDATWGHSLRDEVMRAVPAQPEYVERAKYELDVIESMGYADYFLVVADLIAWARSQGILVGPGRGSVGGSLVAFLLGVTELDPIAHGLLFERFISLARLSPPDVDTDFQDDRRDEVIRYAVEKYGCDNVAQIVTFGVTKARAAIRDSNRVHGGEYAEADRLAAMIPPDIRGRQHPLEGLTKLERANPAVYSTARGIEGVIRNESKHAAGLIISPVPLSDVIPVKKLKDDEWLTTAFDQETLEAHGLIKLDLLGLKELSIIQKTLEMIDDESPGS